MNEIHESEWTRHGAWWLNEIRDDPIYGLDVLPLFHRLLPQVDGLALDLGCGEGRVMKAMAGRAVGCDIASDLLRFASRVGPVVRSRLPDLRWLRPESIELAYMVLVLEHLPDLEVFTSAFRAVRPGGSMVLVMNHPAFTADGAGPILDPSDGEVLWRWGRYFEPAACQMATSGAEVTFYHRPLADILNAAAAAGWVLDEIVETGFSEEALATEPGYVGQEQMPRLLGVRWMTTQGSRPFRR